MSWVGFYSRKRSVFVRYSQKKQEWLDGYIERNYADIVEKYKMARESDILADPYQVWVFWGQGEDEMPPLVKTCCKQMFANNLQMGGVNFLNLANISDFVQLPNIAYQKLENGQLLYANFSDILRNSLLAKFGGMWLDATCWTVCPIPAEARDNVFFSPHDEKAGCYWETYAMGSNRVGSVTFSFVRDMLLAVCEKEKVWPDYLLQDRLLDFAHRKIKASKQAMNATPTNATKHFLLFPQMNKPFDKELYHRLVATEWFFKLSYKSYYKKECDGLPTFYAAMLDGTMNESEESLE